MNPRWSDDFLESMRQQTDPLADKVVEQVIQSGGLEAFNSMLETIVNNREEIPTSLPVIVQEYFNKTETLPNWADPDKIALGENVFILHGPEMVTMLLMASLPNAYSMARGAHVLAITAQLTKHFHRRIFRTAQFIADVMQSGGLGPNGKGIRSTQKIRLIHASIRYAIKHRANWRAQWNPEWGEPVNQEDMASTLLDFSVIIMRGIKKTGISLTSEEEEAYHHCWRVVGHVLGLDPAMQAENVRDANELADLIAARQAGESNAGTELTRDLIEFVQLHLPRWLKGFAATTIRYYSGNKVANLIKTDSYNWTLIVLYLQIVLMKLFDTFRRNHPGLQKYIRFLTWRIMDRIVLYEEGNTFYFEIPDQLRSTWGLPLRNRKVSDMQRRETHGQR